MVAKKRVTKKTKKTAASHMEYNGSNFHKMLPHFKGDPNVVINILVFMNGCGPCQRIMGPYKKAIRSPSKGAVNMMVESQQLKNLSRDLTEKVPGADSLSVEGYPTIIKLDTHGKQMSKEFVSPSNVGTLTSNVPRNVAEEDIPSGSNASETETNSNIVRNSTHAMSSEEGEDEKEEEEEEEDSIAATNSTVPMAQSIMTGGAAYAALAAAAHRLGSSRRGTRRLVPLRRTRRHPRRS